MSGQGMLGHSLRQTEAHPPEYQRTMRLLVRPAEELFR